MKKLLLAVAAFGMLLTSCAKDDAVAPVVEKEAFVSFCVNAPAVATRYGEGQEATKLQWAVYETTLDASGAVTAVNHLEELDGNKEFKISTTVDFDLIQGRSYEVLFWAADEDAPYTISTEDRTMTVEYGDDFFANQESYDAFYKYESLGTVNGAMSKTIELTRPFAQLNIATADKDAAADAELTVAQTAVKVENIFSTLNLATGEVSGETAATFNLTDRAEGTITVDNVAYDQIAMNYLLVGGKKLVNVELSLSEENSTEVLTRNYSSVPVERNYRTNIVGNILTSAADFTVTILPGFEENDLPFTAEEKLAMAGQAGGEFTLTEDVVLSSALEVSGSLTLNLNGKTLKTAAERGYIITVTEGGSANIKNGKLEVISTNGDIDGTGVSTGGSSAVYCEGGNVTMENVEIIGSQRGGHRAVQVFDGVGDFTNVKIDVNYGTGFNAGSGATVTLKDCEVTVNGMYKAPYNSVCFSVMGGGKLIVESGNYKIINDNVYSTGKSHGGWLGIIMNSGGTMDINGGTFTNVPADINDLTNERSMFSIDATAGLSATLNLNGGIFTPQRNKMVEKGGSGSYDVFAYVDGKLIEGFYVNDGVLAAMYDLGNGSWTIVAKASDASTLTTAIAKGGTVVLTDDITSTEAIEIPAGATATIDLNGKTITVAETDAIVAKAGADLTISGNGKVVAHAAPIRAIGGKVTVEGGEFVQTGDYYSTPSTLRYSVDSREGGEIIIKDGTFRTINGMINVNADSSVVIEGGKFENTVNSAITRHFAYVAGNLTIKDGEFSNKANSAAGGEFFCGAASTGKVVVEGGKFTSLWQSGSKNNIWASYYGGSIEVKGGIFNHNGGISAQVTENTDAATKDAYPYMAK